MIISVKTVRSPRRPHACGVCHRKPIGAHLIIYGTPAEGGRPFSMRVEPGCIPQRRVESEPKIAAALEALRAEA